MSAVRGWSRLDRLVPPALLAVLVYVPLLLTEPGRVAADTKTYLYLDPGRLLSRATSMWDPHVGMGTVPHQQIGYLWPAGPWYWTAERLGLPDWVAQRLWLGSILFGAGCGVLYLARTWRWRPTAATAAAFAYALSPFVLTLAARISVLLLPFAGLPWLLALTVRALHGRGWRHPALFALVLTTVGSVNATSVLLVGLVPVGWILYATYVAREVTRTRAATTLLKLTPAVLAVNLWWIGGLSVQATNGIDVLRYTETAQVVADSSAAPEVLRGLGYWFFYGGDRLGPWIEPGVDYTQSLWLLGLTYAIPAVGLLALGAVRWRHRSFLVGTLAVGVVVAVGAHPWSGPSPIGTLIRAFLVTDLGLAMRSLPRAVPLVALALALALGSMVGAMHEQAPRRGLVGAVLVATVAYAALPPLWQGGMVPENLQRPEDVPAYWEEAISFLDERDDGTRILEVPGIDFASYRWGNTVDPITPGLTDRPYVARELIPYGSAASADLLNALDLRLQESTLPPEGLAALARLMGVGDVVARNDLQYERYNTPRPRSTWDLLGDVPGLGRPVTFGDGVPLDADPDLPLIDEAHLAVDGGLPDAPAVAVFPVVDPRPIVRTAAAEQAVLLSGDGAGIVDAAIAGLLEGDELIRYSADLTDDPDFARTQLVDDRALLVTDTNRKRAQRWTTVRHTQGFTETVDGGILRNDRTDNRLPVLEPRPGTQTVAEHRGLTVRASDYGNPITYTPEERPANATDGDVRTAWRVAAFQDAVGHRIVLTAPEPISTDHVTLLQPQTGAINRWITGVRVRVDGRDLGRVALDESSRTLPGQRVDIGEQTFTEIELEIVADTAGRRPGYAELTSVGFAEIRLEGYGTREVVRLPSDLLDAGGFRTLRYPLALVMTRQRAVATEVTRDDEEHDMLRAVDLPVTRDYALFGTARLSGRAPSTLLDALLGRGGTRAGQPVVTATTRLPGGLAHLPSNVLDGDPGTWWTTAFDAAEGATVRIEAPVPVPIGTIELDAVDDDEHSLPTRAVVRVDGTEVATAALTTAPTGTGPDGTRLARTSIPVPDGTVGRVVEVVVDRVEARTTTSWHTDRPTVLPVALAEVSVPVGEAPLRVPPLPLGIDTGCRSDLVRVDDRPVAVRIQGNVLDALRGRGLDLRDCGATTLDAGDRLVATAPGRVTGLDVDQLVWRSASGGDPFVLDLPLVPDGPDGVPTVSVTGGDDATVEVAVEGAQPGRPFWLVLGQSHNDGWALQLEGDAEVSGPHLVDGYANGFLVTPTEASFDATLRFVPQNRVEVALLVSLLGAIGALALALSPSREVRPLPIPLQEPLRRIRAFSWEGALPRRSDAVAVGVGAGALAGLVVSPLAGLAIGVLAGFATRREHWRPAFVVAPAVLLAVTGLYVLGLQYRNEIGPGLHWPSDTGRLHPLGLVAVILLVVDVVIDRVWASRSDFR